MIWPVVERYPEFAGGPAQVAPPVAYATFDGLFQRAPRQHPAGRDGVAEDLEHGVSRLLELLVGAGFPAV